MKNWTKKNKKLTTSTKTFKITKRKSIQKMPEFKHKPKTMTNTKKTIINFTSNKQTYLIVIIKSHLKLIINKTR